MIFATSSGVPSRRNGICSSTIFSVPGERIDVSISPGAIELTRTPWRPKSEAISRVKEASAALTREMASDFGRHGVRVNSIAPGEIDTSILSPGTEKIVEEQIPLRRLGTPDEVAKIIYVLCTETSSYVNGAEIHINGGQHV